MPHFRPNYETPIEELVAHSEYAYDDEQLDLISPLEAVETMTPEAQAALGRLAIERAQQWFNTAKACRDALAEQGYLAISRKKPVDLSGALPGLSELYSGQA